MALAAHQLRDDCVQDIRTQSAATSLITSANTQIADYFMAFEQERIMSRSDSQISADPTLRIALLEDDLPQGEMMQKWLAEDGYACYWETSAAAFKRLLSRETFDIAILDWHLPDLSGEEVMRWMHVNMESRIPILFVTSRGGVDNLAHILDQGADDYLAKPLNRVEFSARIRALVRRANPTSHASSIEVGNLRVDCIRSEVFRDRVEVELSPKEYALLVFLLRNLDRLVSRGQIYEAVWGRPVPGSTRTVDTHVSQLRAKLDLTPDRNWKLTSVYQRGYRLEYLRVPAVRNIEAEGSA